MQAATALQWMWSSLLVNLLSFCSPSRPRWVGDEQIDLLSPNKVDISGYAYGGGGRKIIRVEVSLDGGETWLFTELTHPETPTEFGKFWCWCFWKLPVDVSDLASCHDIMCRAWDSSMNTQPKDLTWNVMGMLKYVVL